LTDQRSPFVSSIGDAQRLGALARFDVLRSATDDRFALAAAYVEGGAAIAWNSWYPPASGHPPRLVPADTRRFEGQAGLGVRCEMDLRPGIPLRVGLSLGVRFSASRDSGATLECRDAACRPNNMSTGESSLGRSALFHAGVSITW
jgi:hypothetical protein